MSLKNRRAILAGCARNCGRHLDGVLENMGRLGALFGETAVVVTENDSQDDTRARLDDWLARRPQGHLISLDGLDADVPNRTARIAAARNAYLEFALERYPSFDHLIVFDMDDVNARPIAVDGFQQAVHFLDADATRAAVFANQRTRYYDISAVRHATWSPGDCWKDVAARPRWMSWPTAMITRVHRRQFPIPETAAPVRVRSAGGGLGVYKLSWLLHSRYAGIAADGSDVCEHVPLNLDICARGGALYVFPGLLNDAPAEHLFDASRFSAADVTLMRLIVATQTLVPPWKSLYRTY